MTGLDIPKPSNGCYCPMCDTVWAAPGECQCDANDYKLNAPLIAQAEMNAKLVAKALWNGAIAKCVGIVESANLRQFEKEVLIRLMKEERKI